MVVFLTKIKEKLKSYNYRHINVRLFIWLYALLILGLNVIASATKYDHYESKQLLGIIVGSVAIVILTLIDYHFILKFYWVIYFLNLALLIGVKIIGENVKGAQRWVTIAGIQIQPSEFAKIFLVLFFAKLMLKYKDKLNTFKDGNKTSQWAQSSVEGAIEAGYLNGDDQGLLNPTNNITRAEAISMLSRVKK